MSFTNAQLAQKISDLIEYWSSFNTEYSNWLGGTVSGGPGSDGKYPLTNWAGDESLVDSPAKLADNVSGYVGLASASEAAAAASAAAALASETAAAASASAANTDKDAAASSAAAAAVSEGNADSSATVATAQANLATDRVGYAEEWANAAYQTLVSVAAGGNGVDEYSAKHWAQVAENFAGSVDSGLYGQLAQAETAAGIWTFTNGINVGAQAVTAALVANWNTAFGWGDHSGLYVPVGGGTFTGLVNASAGLNIIGTESLRLDGQNAAYKNSGWLYLATGSGFSSGVYVATGQLQTNGAIRSNTGQYYGRAANDMIADYADGYLRLNQSGDYTNGTYTPGDFRANGTLSKYESAYSDYTYLQRAAYDQEGVDFWNFHGSAAVTAGTWYTIATDPAALDITTTPVGKSGAHRSAARIRVWDTDSGQHSFCEFEVSCQYGRRPSIQILNRSSYGSTLSGVRGIRIVRYSTYNGVAVQVLAGHTGTLYVSVQQLHAGGFHGRAPAAQTPHATWYVESVDFNSTGFNGVGWAAFVEGATGADQTLGGIAISDGRFHPSTKSPEGYFKELTGSYGSVCVDGAAGTSGTWGGYSLQNEYVFMSYAGVGRCGIYNDIDSEWMQQWYRNAGTLMYYNGVLKLETTSAGAKVTGQLDIDGIVQLSDVTSLRVTTAYGYGEFGPKNSSYCHMNTDRPSFYSNKGWNFDGQCKFYNKGAMPYYDSSTYGSAKISVGSTAPSSPSTGDLWFDTS